MPGAIRDFGRAPDSYTAHFLEVATGTQRASVGPAGSGSGTVILSRIRARVGKRTSTNAVGRIGIMATDSSGRPNTVLGYTDEFTTTVLYTGSGEGETRTFDLATPIVVAENALLAFVATSRVGTMGVGMEVTSASALYDRALSGGTSIPQNGYSSIASNGRNAIQAQGERNERPNQPGPVQIHGDAGSQRPTMAAGFSDPNETLRFGQTYDYLHSHRHVVSWGGVQRWTATYEADSGERTNRISWRQIGIDIPYDTEATYTVYHRDRAGLESVARTHTFTIKSGASVDAPTAPTGRITNTSNPGSITAIYRHSGGLNANAVKYQLRNASGGLIKESGTIAKTVAPNGTITDTWATSTLGTLADGTAYQVTIVARATDGNWSQPSAPAIITTNARPNTPVQVSPANGFISGSLVSLVVEISDPDQPITQLTSQFEFRTPADVVIGTLAGARVGSTQRHQVNPSGAISTHQTFQWRARVYDGYLWSNWTPLRTYVYAAVPVVTVTAPTNPVSTSQPVFTWTAAGQTHWRIQAHDGDRLVYDTEEQAGGTQAHTVQSQYWVGGEQWNNNESFTWTVSVRDSSTLWGASAPLALTLEYDPIAELSIVGTSMQLPGVEGTHFNLISIGQTTYPQGDFIHYVHRRVAINGPGGSEIAGTAITLAVVENSADTDILDFDVRSRQWYRYISWQTVRVGNDVISSEPVSVELMCEWHGTLLHSKHDPLNDFVWLQYGAPNGNYAPGATWQQGFNVVQPMSSRAPLDFSGAQDTVEWNHTYTLLDQPESSADAKRDALRRIWDYQNAWKAPNGRPNSVMFREGRGGADGLVYGRLVSINKEHWNARHYVVDLTFSERHHVVGSVNGDVA